MAPIPPDIRSTLARTLTVGLVAALVAGAAVWATARARLGPDDRAAMTRVAADVQARVADREATLTALAAHAVAENALVRRAEREPEAAERLFGLARGWIGERDATTGLTIYDAAGTPLAWAGRVLDVPRGRLRPSPAVFMTFDPLGPRLVVIEDVPEVLAPVTPQRGGVAVAEALLADLGTTAGIHVTIAPEDAGGGADTFLIRSTRGTLIATARLSPSDLAESRAWWTRASGAALLAGLGLTLLACVSPLVQLRRRARARSQLVVATAAVFAAIAGCRAIAGVALTALDGAESGAPFRLLLNALTLVALVWLALDLAERRRLARPRLHLHRATLTALSTAALFFVAGLADAWIIAAYEYLLRGFVNATGLDLLHFSLHPLSANRAAISFALVLLHAGVVWAGALALRLAAVGIRRPRRAGGAWSDFFVCGCGLLAGVWTAWMFRGPLPPVPVAVALFATILCAAALARPRGPFRRASQAARLALLYAALLVPALALYPSLEAFAMTAKDHVVADRFAPEAIDLREDLKRQSDRAIEQIDAMPDLARLVDAPSDADAPSTDQAFNVWTRTALAEHRITSAIELYAANGRPISRFALNLPEYTSALHIAPSCRWTTFEEVTSFAASDRRVLRATRGVCTREGMVGAIVVRVMLDYRTLPFISSQRPYVEPTATSDDVPAETTLGRDVEFTVYGWSQAPLYAFGGGLWRLPTPLFDALVGDREPRWATLARDDGRTYRVYFASDRGGIYALGYPVITAFGHAVNLAELVVLTSALWALLLAGATIFSALTSRTPASGRALLREVQSSFYWKLWLAFVGAAVVPVLIVAFATRTYFANQFSASVKDDALRIATVAQRLVEDYAALQPRQSGTLEALDDQVMILVSQAIDQDVNLFDPKRLQATSQPDLFASGLLPPRTPDDVYRAVALNRLPAFVGVERVGHTSYLLAAARVRAGQREGIVTVPLALRAQEADEQIDDLDRQVLFGTVLFVMLAAGIGYWMAERIANPVSRLTRATRRIARGDLDARIAATSSDELRRLVEDFNHMAADLQRQRTELERTQRLEAWADMARQVAHDIKNPLTPIQLSAEHARRVNMDRGRPLSPVLDECVTAILTQVRLLRQIATEFSSFASSPTARPEATNVAALVDEVVEPYRAGLSGRVAIAVERADSMPLIAIDPTLFSRTLTNLIENAIFAMAGGGTLTISSRLAPAGSVGSRTEASGTSASGAHQPSTSVTTADHGASIVVSVADTGAGMDQDALDRIFEPYFSTKATGTGLGLTIAKRNVELNNGTIQVASTRGVGTTVTLTFPVRT